MLNHSDEIILHCCCAPCSGAIIEKLVGEGEKPVLFFSNSNIDSREEFDKRLAELERYAAGFGLEVVTDPYDHKEWLRAVEGLENEPERGRRCLACFRYRLERAARFAVGRGPSTLTTTLASSRWKSLGQVDRAGSEACAEVASSCGNAPLWWPCNWRKGGLQERRSAIIREQNFYNQNYCGCEFSRRSTTVGEPE